MRRLGQLVNKIMGRVGLSIVRKSTLEPTIARRAQGSRASDRSRRLAERPDNPHAEPGPSADTLVYSNPRLAALRLAAARAPSPSLAPSQWSAEFVESQLDLATFRADNAYLWQERDQNR